MSCNVPMPSIEAHVTPRNLSKNRTYENKGHSKCLHNFFEHPFVLPDSVPDDLVAGPKKASIFRKNQPPTIAPPSKSPPSERNRQVRELLEASQLLASLKHHGRTNQPLNTTVHKPPGTLLQSVKETHFPRLAANAFFRNLPMPPPPPPQQSP